VTTRKPIVFGDSRANAAVIAAIKSGRLVRDVPCEVCGRPQARKGRGWLVLFHHWSYKPRHWLDVIPLCDSHHQLVHSGSVREPRTGRIHPRGRMGWRIERPQYMRLAERIVVIACQPNPTPRQRPRRAIHPQVYSMVRDELSRVGALHYERRIGAPDRFVLGASPPSAVWPVLNPCDVPRWTP